MGSNTHTPVLIEFENAQGGRRTDLMASRDVGWWYDVAEQVQALGKAWDDPAVWQGSTDAAGVELSNELWGKIALTEMVVHGCALAQSTGHAFNLPEHML